MDYFNENLKPEQIVKASRTIAVPGGRENGDVLTWLTENGLDVPEFNGRCLHMGN